MSDGRTGFALVVVLAVFLTGGFIGAVVVAPKQAEARAARDSLEAVADRQPEAVESAAVNGGSLTPVRQHDTEAAYHACTALVERLEQDLAREWGTDE